ncbi:MAG: diphthine--ammonia ligase [Thermoplasmata archaeon]
MSVTALVSGGKDSLYSAYLAETQGWPVDELLTLAPSDPESLLFHTPNLSLVPIQAEAWGRVHRSVPVRGTGEVAEVEGLTRALAGRTGTVVAGAIASSYQWGRLHRVCFALGLRLYTPLWGKAAETVVREEIGAGLDIRLVHLAAEPLSADLLGRRLDGAMLDEIRRRAREVREVNVAGEGGEYETLVVDAPFWKARIALDDVECRTESGVSRCIVRRAHLEPHDADARAAGTTATGPDAVP